MEIFGSSLLIANPSVVFREEFDDWAILFDPDTGEGFGLNPMGAWVWGLLDGDHAVSDILREMKMHCGEIPDEAEEEVLDFLRSLVEYGLAGHECPNGFSEKS